MQLHNFYKPVTMIEPYDPKQRLVGAFVLFLIILLIYGILKLLLGMEYGKFVIPYEPKTIITTENFIEDKQDASNILPKSFIFLNLNGSPLQEEFYEEVEAEIINDEPNVNEVINEAIEEPETIIPEEKSSLIAVTELSEPTLDICEINADSEQWYVLQAASFKNEQRAQHLVQKIKEAKLALDGCIIQSRNGWYAVRLPPETDHRIVQYQYKRLYQLLRIKGLIKKINSI